MFKHGFPPEWSTFKKLIWLVGSGIAGAAAGVWKTVTGTLIHITDALASPMQKCEVTLEPIQDLHGQDAPYPAGGGKNKFHFSAGRNAYSWSDGFGFSTISADDDGITFNGTATSSHSFGVTGASLSLKAGSYRLSTESDNVGIAISKGGNTICSVYGTASGGAFTIAEDTDGITIQITVLNGASFSNKFIGIQLEEGSTATAWSPYENICPITGWTGCEVWVKDEYDTSLPSTASVTFPDGQTVYGGKYDFVSGGLKPYKEYDSYNGETLTGRWMSSMDKYVAGTTPTIGAQVVDLDGYDTTVQLTPQEISTLAEENNVWSNGDSVEITYKAQAS